jgi:hypothetical protein
LADDVWIIMPARDEALSIGDVIVRTRAELDAPVVVVDDRSSDDTCRVAAASGAVVLPLSVHLGAWGATQTGIRYALSCDPRAAVTLDADGQHDPKDIAALLRPLQEGAADVVIGSCVERGSAARRLAWRVLRHVTGLDVADLTSGFRAYNRKALELLASKEATLLDYQDVGVLLFLQKAGLRIVEVPVRMCPRLNGHSRIFSNWGAVFRYLLYSGVLSVSRRNHWRLRPNGTRQAAAAAEDGP